MTFLMQIEGMLSREEKYRALNRQFENPKPYALITILGLLALILSIPLILKFIQHIRLRFENAPRHRPRRLLWDLAGTASLGILDRVALLNMARKTEMTAPAALLLCPAVFDRVWHDWAKAGGGFGIDRMKQIRTHLFPK